MELKFSHDLITTSSRLAASGFDMFIHGYGEPKNSDYGDKSEWFSLLQGYNYAKKMAKEDGIAFTHVFKCGYGSCHPFLFGGFFVCNGCGRKNVDADWWKIQVEKDGNAYCCHGLDFIDLQSSDNYAFGDTFEEAIANYETTMLKLLNQPTQ